ncbi:uncharacterized protein LOC135141781 isoform X2 [Zophobas morio]|uniref:uncharacterized protein LOC135141781 isoform X2 n=1 Tax=Zophobas morio TaxID=2755281 RepID=UPI003083BCC6
MEDHSDNEDIIKIELGEVYNEVVIFAEEGTSDIDMDIDIDIEVMSNSSSDSTTELTVVCYVSDDEECIFGLSPPDEFYCHETLPDSDSNDEETAKNTGILKFNFVNPEEYIIPTEFLSSDPDDEEPGTSGQLQLHITRAREARENTNDEENADTTSDANSTSSTSEESSTSGQKEE